MKQDLCYFILLYIVFVYKVSCNRECPDLKSIKTIQSDTNESIRNFLQIPNTSIVLLNIQQNDTLNTIVYYFDTSSPEGEIIKIINSETNIEDWTYAANLNQILIINNSKLIWADPFTLRSIKSYELQELMDIQMIEGTQYVIIIMWYYNLNIIDTETQEMIMNCDNRVDESQRGQWLFEVTYTTLKDKSFLIIITGRIGVFTWTVDLDSRQCTYNGIFPVDNFSEDTIRVSKYISTTIDLFFLAGFTSNIYAIEINDISTRSYTIWNQTYSGPILILTTYETIIQLTLEIDETNKSIVINNPDNPFTLQASTLQTMNDQTMHYSVNGNFILVGDIQLYKYNIDSKQLKSYSKQISLKQRRFKFEFEEFNHFVSCEESSILFYTLQNYASSTNKVELNTPIIASENSSYNVLNCLDCLFIRSGDAYIYKARLYPTNQQIEEFDLSHIGLSWKDIGNNFQPFQSKNYIWLVIGFYIQQVSPGYLFLLINTNTGSTFQLKTMDDSLNEKVSSFAMISIEDSSNKEIIGVDIEGNIYFWNHSSPYAFKNYASFDYCTNSQYGDIFHYNKNKFIILACDNLDVKYYDTKFQKQTTLMTLPSSSVLIRAFSKQLMIAICNSEYVYLFKFIVEKSVFDHFLTIQPAQISDQIVWVDFLKDQTFWLQYQHRNVFFEIMSCLDDPSLCQNCELSFYFNQTDVFDLQNGYGSGNSTNPYSTSHNLFSSLLQVNNTLFVSQKQSIYVIIKIKQANSFKETIPNILTVQVNIIINPINGLKLINQFISLEFSKYIYLQFMSLQNGKQAEINNENALSLTSYSQLQFQDVILIFPSIDKCLITFTSIAEGVTLQNTNLFDLATKNNCFQIKSDLTNLKIKSQVINGTDFSSMYYAIDLHTSSQLSIENTLIQNCIFPDTFSFVKSSSQLKANFNNLKLLKNECSNLTQNQQVSPFFQAGLFEVEDINIRENRFCNKILFLVLSSSSQTDQEFIFKQMKVELNQFRATSNNIFIEAKYAMITTPSHSLKIFNVTFANNALFSSNLKAVDLISTNKIAKLDLNQIQMINHTDISLGTFSYQDLANFKEINCTNLLAQSFNQNFSSCFSLLETQESTLTSITIDNKYIKDKSLISFTNQLYSDARFTIISSNFTNLHLSQTETNKRVNPVMIQSKNSLIFSIQNCIFKNNYHNGLQYSLLYGTTGLWIENYLGTVLIENSQFLESYSNSKYNFLKINSHTVQIQSSTFSNSQTISGEAINQIEGGFFNGKVQYFTVEECLFEKSQANKGGFIFLESFNQTIDINISGTIFSEGQASQDGGAIYVNLKNSTLTFDCQNCEFKKIKTLSLLSSAIAFEQQQRSNLDIIHSLRFQSSKIQDIFGKNNTYFINIQNSELEMFDLIRTDSSRLRILLDSNSDLQQSCFIKSSSSSITIRESSIINLEPMEQTQTIPLILQADLSTINLNKVIVQGLQFSDSIISIESSKLLILESSFSNLIQSSSSSGAINLDLETASPSLIKIYESNLISQSSQFNSVSCNECNGGIFQFLESSFQIISSKISSTEAKYGGVIFIKGINSINTLTDSLFSENTSKVDGGAIYFNSESQNEFTLNVIKSNFTNNSAQNGSGGGLFIISDILNNSKQIIIIEQSLIKGNTAQIGGGINSKSIAPVIDQVTVISGNSAAFYGNNQISYPSHLKVRNIESFLKSTADSKLVGNTLYVDNFRSGSTLSELQFILESEFEEEVKPIDSNDTEFSVTVGIDPASANQNKLALRGLKTVYYSNGFSFSDLVLVGNPGQSTTLQFNSTQIKVLNRTNQQYNSVYSFLIVLNVRQCLPGELINSYGQYTECAVCKSGTYSFNTEQCYDCPFGAICPGGSTISPNQGYWRKNSTSSDLILCDNLESNCNGVEAGNKSCFEGHIGALCEECDIYGEYWGSPYAKKGKYGCVNCNSINSNLWVLILMTIWTQISMTLAIKGDIQTLEEKAAGEMLKRNLSKKRTTLVPIKRKTISSSTQVLSKSITNLKTSTLNSNQPQQTKSGVFIKMLTNYFQIVSSIATFNLSVPSGIVDVPTQFGQPLSQTMNSLDCALVEMNSDIPIIYLRLIFSMLIPIVYMLIFLFGLIFMFLKSKQKKKFPYYIVTTATMFMLIYIQPDLVTQTIALVSCRKIGDTSYILSNVAYECNSENYVSYSVFLLMPLLIILVVVIPFSLFWVLHKNKIDLDNPSVKLKYGFLYKEYKNEAFYWEFIKMMEKLIIILSLSFYSQSIVTKGVLVFITIVIYSILSLIVKPYKEEDINLIDVNSTNVCAITILLGLFLYKNDFSYFVYPTFLGIIIINALFFYSVLRKIFQGYIDKIKEILNKIIQKNIKFLEFLKRFKEKEPEKKEINPELKMKFRRALYNFMSKEKIEKRIIVTNVVASWIDQDLSKDNRSTNKIIQDLIEKNKRTDQEATSSKEINIGNLTESVSFQDSLPLKSSVFESPRILFPTSFRNIISPRIEQMNRMGLTPVHEEQNEISFKIEKEQKSS